MRNVVASFKFIQRFFFYFEALQFGKFTSWRTSFLTHSSFSEIKVRQHFVNVYVFALKKPLVIGLVIKQIGEQTVIIPAV